MMTWYHFQAKVGHRPEAPFSEVIAFDNYRYYDGDPDPLIAMDDCKHWAGLDVRPDAPITCTAERVDAPPLVWLETKLKGALALWNTVNTDIRIYEEAIAYVQKSKTVPVTSDKEEGT